MKLDDSRRSDNVEDDRGSSFGVIQFVEDFVGFGVVGAALYTDCALAYGG